MIQLIRVYNKDERVIRAEAYDHDEYPPPLPPHLRCRCFPTPIWRTRQVELKHEFNHHKITVETIYLTPRKDT